MTNVMILLETLLFSAPYVDNTKHQDIDPSNILWNTIPRTHLFWGSVFEQTKFVLVDLKGTFGQISCGVPRKFSLKSIYNIYFYGCCCSLKGHLNYFMDAQFLLLARTLFLQFSITYNYKQSRRLLVSWHKTYFTWTYPYFSQSYVERKLDSILCHTRLL